LRKEPHAPKIRVDFLEKRALRANAYRLEFTDPDDGKVTETLRDGTARVLYTGTPNAMVDRTSRVMGLCLD
jgi:hypothetical protein